MDWKVFQTDVLDALNQYKGYYDFFERTGTLSNNSRPDCIARITRDRKKIWVFDAKNKASITEEDEKRMKQYVEQLRQKPVDIGLDRSEIGEHSIEGVFITRGKASSDFKVVESSKLHQYLRKELVYTETDRVVRDVAQMAEKEALKHSQVRMLYRSLKGFRETMEKARSLLEDLEKKFVSLDVKEHPLDEWESLPVDFMIEHPERPPVFVDVPYDSSKLDEVEEILDEDSVYVSLGGEGEYGCPFSEFEEQLIRKQGIIPWGKASKLFDPKIPTEIRMDPRAVTISSGGAAVNVKVYSRNDTSFKVVADLPGECVERIEDQSLNARKDFCRIEGNKVIHSFKVTEDFKIDYGPVESFESYKDTVNTVYQSAVNPVLSKKVRNP